MNNVFAVNLECELNDSWLKSRGVRIKKRSLVTPFGKVNVAFVDNSEGRVLVFENGGMSGSRSLPDCSMPIFYLLWKEKVNKLFLFGFCGAMTPTLGVGHLAIPNDFVDMTKNRGRSFIEQVVPGELFFYGMREPFDPELVKVLDTKARDLGLAKRKLDQVLTVTEGPRFETRAEINLFKNFSDIVCMSGVPDATFCRELGISYAAGLFVSNMAEGVESAGLGEVLEVAKNQVRLLTELIYELMGADYSNVNSSYHKKYWMQQPDWKKLDSKLLGLK